MFLSSIMQFLQTFFKTRRARYAAAFALLLVLIISVAASLFFSADRSDHAVNGQAASAPPSDEPAPGEAALTLVLFGDSLTAGYGLAHEDGFAAVLERALEKAGHDVIVVNAGVSGDTSAAGLARLDWSLGADVSAVVLELGANDALRGVPPSETRRNLAQMIERITERGIPVLFAGMRAPPNLGAEYENSFNAIFSDLAGENDVLFYPFFLEGVAARAKYNQADGIHPNEEGVKIIVAGILPQVEVLLARAASARQQQKKEARN